MFGVLNPIRVFLALDVAVLLPAELFPPFQAGSVQQRRGFKLKWFLPGSGPFRYLLEMSPFSYPYSTFFPALFYLSQLFCHLISISPTLFHLLSTFVPHFSTFVLPFAPFPALTTEIRNSGHSPWKKQTKCGKTVEKVKKCRKL